MERFYNIVSVVFMPLLMPLYGVLFLFQLDNFSYLPLFFKGVTVGGTVFFTIILPLVPLLILRRSGQISDIFISCRKQRSIPYVFSLMAYALWTYFFWHTLQMPLYIVGMAAGACLSIALLACINLKWKISAHMAGIGGFVGSVFGLCYRVASNPVGFIVILPFFVVLLGLARIELKAHTPTQVLAGFVVGFLSISVCCLSF